MTEDNNIKNENIAKRVRRKIRNAAVSFATVAVVGTGVGYHAAGNSADAKNDVKKEVPAKTVKSQYGTFTRDENTKEKRSELTKLFSALSKRDLSGFKSAEVKSGVVVRILNMYVAEFDMLKEKYAEFMLEAMKVTLKECSKDDGASLICHVKEKIRQDIREHHGIKISSDNDKGVEKFCKDQNSQSLGKLFGFCKKRVSADMEKQLEASHRQKEKKKKEDWVYTYTITLPRGR